MRHVVSWCVLACVSCSADRAVDRAVARIASLPPPTVVDRLVDLRQSAERPSGAVVDTVMIHFSSNAVQKPESPYVLDDVLAIYGQANVSAHYLIERDGTLLRLVDERRAARHAGKGHFARDSSRDDRLNETSIGIELLAVGSQRDMKLFLPAETYARIAPRDIGFTDAQYESLRALLGDLHRRHPEIALDRRHVIGHDEYAPARRSDPGELFAWGRLGLQ